jgi:hypothetical protein
LAADFCDKNPRMAKTAVPNSSSTTNYTPTHDEVAAHAYQIYLREGCAEGRDLDHWLQAEAELRLRAHGNGNGLNGHADGEPRTERPSAPARATKPEPSAALPNSVVPPGAPIAQVTRGTTPRRPGGKREAAAAK